MTTTISFPSDPVTNGATEIQTTNFALVAADYSLISWGSAQQYINGKGQRIQYFPKTGVEDPNWTFYIRKDMSGSNASLRNLIGVHVVKENSQINAFSGALAKQVAIPIQTQRIEVYNWHPATITLTDGTVVTRIMCAFASYYVVVDPESGGLLFGDGSHRVLTEAIGFMLTPVAANKPVNTPALNALSGINPLG
jgi:hypothetical protein